jgi:CPA2 family monovalent cation:H+ antiporter-2
VIEPFQGLLLGFFFISTGVGLDLDAVAARPELVLGVAVGLTLAKIAAIFLLARAFKTPTRTALETAMVLGPAGEFAFVIVGSAMTAGLVPAAVGSGAMISATLSLFAIPFLAMAATRLRKQIPGGPAPAPTNEELEAAAERPRVLIVGYGRVGRLIGEMLAVHEVPFAAVDTDPTMVANARRDGARVWYGDAASPDMLRLCGLSAIEALIVTMDAPGKVDEVVKTARALRSDMIVIARARDARHAARLYALGVTDAVPETTEASLQLAENTLIDLGVPMGAVLASIHERRDVFRKLFQAAAPVDRTRPTRALRSRLRPEPPLG